MGIDGARAFLVLVLAIGQAVMAYWPDMRNWDETITSRSASLDTLIVPFGPFFAIWILIFAGCIAFGVWHGLPGNLDDPMMRATGWWAAALFAGNIAWEFYVPKRGLDGGSVALLITELVLALMVSLALVEYSPFENDLSFWLGAAPLFFIAGWIGIAVFAMLSSTMLLAERPGLDARKPAGVSIFVLAATAVIAPFAWTFGTLICAVSAAWGLIGIAVGGLVKSSGLVSALSATAALFVPLSALVG